ncbi:carbon storage regulator CsrA [Candidatus Parcubacteria bacterium]|nr:carbon storage regulator CsrA [Candidatus Parcubacteria bacterium]
MLVLTRRLGERIKIGDDVVVVVLEIKGGQVRLGIGAPRSVPVHREEIWRKIQQQREENGGAAGADAPSLLCCEGVAGGSG